MSGPYAQPLVYFFGQGRADGTAAMKDVLGGKGAGLAEMTTIGIPVPPGFTIASSLCLSYLDSHQFPKRLQIQVENALHRVEAATGKHFGDGDNPLLVSVRSGAAVSMPGMMETILNLGLNDVTVEGLTRQSRNPQFAWDSYRRFVQMYGSVVFDLSRKPFEHILEEHRQRCGVERDIDLSGARRCRAIVRRFKEHVRAETGRDFPSDPLDQLWGAIAAVFESWNTRRAIDYRKLHDIPDSMGTAVNVVAMVYGNLGEDSGTGVAFTPRSVHRRAGALRRVPAQRAGRGRRVGRSDAAADRDAEGPACRPPTRSWSGWRARSSGTSATCRTWSSPSSAARCTCCRRAEASARATRRCGSPARWWTRSSSPRKRRSPAFRRTT